MDNYINCNGSKIPTDTGGRAINHLDPANWISLEQATRNKLAYGLNVSYVLKSEQGVWCLDVDKCIKGGELSDTAKEILRDCAGFPVYIEESISGTGLHVWGRHELGLITHKCKNTSLGIEIYTNDRHIVLGTKAPISLLSNLQAILDGEPSSELFNTLLGKYFKGDGVTASADQWNNLSNWNKTPVEVTIGNIKKRKTSSTSNPFTNTLSLNQILELTLEDWEQQDKSSLDIALLNHLAFNLGPYHEAISKLYLETNVGQYRSKEIPNKLNRSAGVDCQGWRVTYLQRTILRVVAECSEFWKSPAERKAEQSEQRVAEIKERVNSAERGAPDSPAGYYIADFCCIYNGDSPKYLCTSSGHELGQTSFKQCFKIDGFEFEQAFPERVLAGKVYAPGEPTMFEDDHGLRWLNTYRPPEMEHPTAETVELLETYFSAICPNESLRVWLKQWCAHLIQRPKVKILSSVILGGREQGTGKSTLGVLLSKAVGKGNTARINSHTLGDQYNDWLSRAVFGISEELTTEGVGVARTRRIKETVKDWITTRDIAIREMYKSTEALRTLLTVFYSQLII